jgi:putative flippase GtrA
MIPAEVRRHARHFGGFILAGVLALLADLAILRLLTDWIGLSALIARPASIAIAMVVSWWVNRTVTFAVASPARISELVKFAGVSWFAQAVNYGVFGLILLARPETTQEAAVIAASLVSMLVSYAGFRFGVFRQQGKGT